MSFIQTISAENQALCACDQGRFFPEMPLWAQVLEVGGREDRGCTWAQRNEASPEYQAQLKAPRGLGRSHSTGTMPG